MLSHVINAIDFARIGLSKFSTTISVFDETNPDLPRYTILKRSELAQYLVKFLLSGLV